MRLNVLNVAYPLAPVREETAGGAEQILLCLDKALVDAGHNSIVIACEGSTPAGRLICTRGTNSIIDEKEKTAARQRHRSAIDHALKNMDIDIIHMHGLDFDSYLPESDVPVIVTLHLPLDWYSPAALQLNRPDTELYCVSESQLNTILNGRRPEFQVIKNGIDPDQFRFSSRKRDFVLMLGRICPEKGQHIAIEAARRAEIPLIIAGEIFRYPEHDEYFSEYVLPHCNNEDCIFIGPLGRTEKSLLLSEARCVLVPSLAEETSSLVSMEAFASGTPVVAFPSGALAEIVEHGRTGFLVRSAGDMAKGISMADALDPAECRKVAEEKFSSKVMIGNYFNAYYKFYKGMTT